MNTLLKSKNTLGESPTWHKERKSLFWVDILQNQLFEYALQTQNQQTWSFEFKITAVAIETYNTVILATQNGIIRFNLETKAIDWLQIIDEIDNSLRLNDGKCDAKGRFWVGSMDNDCKNDIASLYCFVLNQKLQKKQDKIIESNGIAWSIDSKKMYFIDSMTYNVKSFHFDLTSGNINFEKICIQIPETLGIPDGMTIDKEGMLWIAIWGGFCISRWNPETGEMLEKIDFPAPNITSCSFCGENADTLFITSARLCLSEDELLKYPESGNIFSYKPKIGGFINHYFKN